MPAATKHDSTNEAPTVSAEDLVAGLAPLAEQADGFVSDFVAGEMAIFDATRGLGGVFRQARALYEAAGEADSFHPWASEHIPDTWKDNPVRMIDRACDTDEVLSGLPESLQRTPIEDLLAVKTVGSNDSRTAILTKVRIEQGLRGRESTQAVRDAVDQYKVNRMDPDKAEQFLQKREERKAERETRKAAEEGRKSFRKATPAEQAQTVRPDIDRTMKSANRVLTGLGLEGETLAKALGLVGAALVTGAGLGESHGDGAKVAVSTALAEVVKPA